MQILTVTCPICERETPTDQIAFVLSEPDKQEQSAVQKNKLIVDTNVICRQCNKQFYFGTGQMHFDNFGYRLEDLKSPLH